MSAPFTLLSRGGKVRRATCGVEQPYDVLPAHPHPILLRQNPREPSGAFSPLLFPSLRLPLLSLSPRTYARSHARSHVTARAFFYFSSLSHRFRHLIVSPFLRTKFDFSFSRHIFIAPLERKLPFPSLKDDCLFKK